MAHASGTDFHCGRKLWELAIAERLLDVSLTHDPWFIYPKPSLSPAERDVMRSIVAFFADASRSSLGESQVGAWRAEREAQIENDELGLFVSYFSLCAMKPERANAPMQPDFGRPEFAQYYDGISDTFIPIDQVAASFIEQTDPQELVFEIGIGTGYFASYLIENDRRVCGIEPSHDMRDQLAERLPRVKVEAARLEEYTFDQLYKTIVSHSSVFLVTRLGETDELVFQSFIQNRKLALEALEKVLAALAPGGRFFINIQSNPKERATTRDGAVFEMIECNYDLQRESVRKVFRMSVPGMGAQFSRRLGPDFSLVLPLGALANEIGSKRYRVEVVDQYWVACSRA